MKPYSRTYRHWLYKNALQLLMQELTEKGYYVCGLCRVLTRAHMLRTRCHFDFFYSPDNMNRLPEIVKHRKKDRGSYWFPTNNDGVLQRIEVLRRAIRLTAPIKK